MNSITINRIDASELIPQTYNIEKLPAKDKLEKIARLYAEVFADPPWNQYKSCPEGHEFGREAQVLTICADCKKELKLMYPEGEIVKYIPEEVGEPNGTLILFEDKEEDVYAAGWGFSCSLQKLKAKYRTQEMQQKCEEALKDKGETFFYVSEVMVDERAREQKIATKITNLLLERANALEWNMVLRTRNDSPMVFIANKLSMDLIVEEDSEKKGRVLYLRTLK